MMRSGTYTPVRSLGRVPARRRCEGAMECAHSVSAQDATAIISLFRFQQVFVFGSNSFEQYGRGPETSSFGT